MFTFVIVQQKRLKETEHKKLIAEMENEKIKLEHEQEINKYEQVQLNLEKDKQQELLASKLREITSYSLLVANKNQLLNQINELNTQAFNSQKDARNSLSKIAEIIKDNLSIDQEWDNFKMHFDEVHPDFFKKLKKTSENTLTEENLKMCAYIKMGMTTKQVAHLLHIEPASILQTKYRLKIKLKLDEDKSLTDYLRNL